MPSCITVNRNNEFFIAICKQGNGAHSYVSLGVKEADGNTRFLASFGKIGHSEAKPSCLSITKFFCSVLFSNADAVIINEPIILHERKRTWRSPIETHVNYKAYGITYEHYLQFLSYLALVSAEQRKRFSVIPLAAYLPVEDDGDDENTDSVTLELQSINQEEDDQNLINVDDNILSLGNTCRHSAICLIEKARKNQGLGAGISTFFLKPPPLKARFSEGMVKNNAYFYILPLPPTSFSQVSAEKSRILGALYQRLDEMVLIAQENTLTIEKFEKLKKLYQRIANKLPDNIFAVMSSIEAWEEKHQALIIAHREKHWFKFATATERMFNKFHEQFDDIREARNEEQISIQALASSSLS